jgi:hypothetical protein
MSGYFQQKDRSKEAEDETESCSPLPGSGKGRTRFWKQGVMLRQ